MSLFLSNLVKMYRFYLLLSKLHLDVEADKVSISSSNNSISVVMHLDSGRLEIKSSSSLSLNGQYVFLNCEKERQEFIEQERRQEREELVACESNRVEV